MNILILSPGRRVEVVEYFKEVFHRDGGLVYTLDMSPYAPALYLEINILVLKRFQPY